MSGERQYARSVEEPQADAPAKPRVDLLDYLLYPLFVLSFLLVLVVFELIERVAFAFGGRRALKRRVIPWMSFWLLQVLKVIGVRVSCRGAAVIDTSLPYIIVSNHQSLFDIPIIGYFLRDTTPQFIAKTELGKWIPGTSFSLRNSGDILIDRSNVGQALKEIVRMGRRLNEENTSAVIFPEGTRARDGKLKHFKPSGLEALLKSAPRAKIIPVVIDGSWYLQCRPFGPVARGIDIHVEIAPAIDPSAYSDRAQVVEETEKVIVSGLARLRAEHGSAGRQSFS